MKICLPLLFFTFLISAQKITLKGKITDSQNRSIENASVSLLDNDNNILAYTFSDVKGSYNLTFENKNKNLILKISGLDFQSQETVINPTQNTVQDFKLEEKITTIKEVLIDGKKIRTNQDTTTIKVQSFANKTEQTVEDILKKIPGIEITKEGIIKAHGKSIDKLLIEGDDLFDKNYKLL